MRCRFRLYTVAAFMLSMLVWSMQGFAAEPQKTEVNGKFTEIDGLPVLRVWGDPEQRAYAYGYLLAHRIERLVDGFLREMLKGDAEHYEKKVLPKLELLKADAEFEVELRALLAGVETRLGGPVKIPFLGRFLAYRDLVAINCAGDLKRAGCSSFAAWDRLTGDGHIISGFNMEWPKMASLLDTQVLVVHVPLPESGDLGWVSITWPPFIGCITGMNAEGVTIASLAAAGGAPSRTGGFTPTGMVFRRAVEAARSGTAIQDMAAVIRKEVCVVGNNLMVTRPHTGDVSASAVFEMDGNLLDGQGLTVRKPEPGDRFLVCTNHFRARTAPVTCDRYDRMAGMLSRIEESPDARYVTIDEAWLLLKSVCRRDVLAYHSVVFEPKKRLMHIAFTENEKNAPECRKVTLNVTRLLSGEY